MRTIVLALVLAGAGCRNRAPNAPYARGHGPKPAVLLEATSARYGALRVPKAKIREGRSPGARLQIRAEAPARMIGSIDIAGNPLITLALHEQGYALRTVRDTPGLPAGFYSGPPSQCAVRGLLGVELPPEQIVALLLGGGPVIEGPHEVLDQQWNDGREHLRIAAAHYEEALEFEWHEGSWWFAGAKLYAREGAQLRWLWTITHEKLAGTSVGVLPEKTSISRPNARGGSSVIGISYAEQIPTPISDPAETSSRGEDGGDAGADGGDGDGFDGGDGWEEDDWDEEGWDDGEHQPKPETPEPSPKADAPAKTEVPAPYRLSPAGLVDRGDLCR